MEIQTCMQTDLMLGKRNLFVNLLRIRSKDDKRCLASKSLFLRRPEKILQFIFLQCFLIFSFKHMALSFMFKIIFLFTLRCTSSTTKLYKIYKFAEKLIRLPTNTQSIAKIKQQKNCRHWH